MTYAVVVGDELNALGVIRSLGGADVPVVKLVTDSRSMAARSRYGRLVIGASTEGEPLLAALRQIAAPLTDRPVLFVTEERTVRTVSACRAELSKAYRIRLPAHEVLMALMHKQGFQWIAEAIRAPVPRLVQLQSDADLVRLAGLKYPCVLKPSAKDYAYGAQFAKAYVVQSADEASALYRRIAPVCADLVVQEWIDGDDGEIYFCLQYVAEGGPIASFTGRKVRSWPPRIGGTASCTAAWDVAEELTEKTWDFFLKAGFTGMGSMEYKRDRRDGRFYMIEPTVARTDFQEEVATLNGVNIPLAAYRFEAGLPVLRTTRPRRDHAWREPMIDRWSQEQQRQALPNAGFGNAKVIDAYFRVNDPMPWVCWMGSRLNSRVRTWSTRFGSQSPR